MKNNNNLAYLILILTTIFWSGNFIVGKAASMFQIPPFSLNFYRWFFAGLILLPFTYKEIVKNKKYITSCIFRLKSIPAALYKCLGGFATNQVNLTKLESFSVKNTFEQANFYLDIEGHLEQPNVKKALEELGFHTETLDILGVYESSAFRQK